MELKKVSCGRTWMTLEHLCVCQPSVGSHEKNVRERGENDVTQHLEVEPWIN